MNKICTDIEQSKKLIEMGIDINTADLTVVDLPIQNGDRFKFISSKLPNDTFSSITDGKSEKIPVWSLSALLELIPNYVINKSDDKIYANLYYDSKSSYDNLVDAAFEMILKLHERNLL